MIKNNKGETIVETLVAILIIALCFVMLENSIVTAARINKQASKENVTFLKDGIETSCTIKVNNKTTNSYKCYTSKDGVYHYYE